MAATKAATVVACASLCMVSICAGVSVEADAQHYRRCLELPTYSLNSHKRTTLL